MGEIQIHEDDAEAVRVNEGLVLKHLAAPWTLGTERLWVGLAELEPGASTEARAIPQEGVHFTLEGTGTEVVGETSVDTSPGSCVHIPAETRHQVVNTGDGLLRVLSVVSPALDPPS